MNASRNTAEVALVVRMPVSLRDDMKTLADAEDRTLASLVRLAVRAYLDDKRVAS